MDARKEPPKRWTEKELEKLRSMLPTKSYDDIAAHFKVTRNVIAGVVFRHRYTDGKKPPVKKERLPKPPNYRVHTKPMDPEKPVKLPKETYIPAKPIPFPPPPGQCLSICGEPKELKCCGHPVVQGRVYCRDHVTAYYS